MEIIQLNDSETTSFPGIIARLHTDANTIQLHLPDRSFTIWINDDGEYEADYEVVGDDNYRGKIIIRNELKGNAVNINYDNGDVYGYLYSRLEPGEYTRVDIFFHEFFMLSD